MDQGVRRREAHFRFNLHRDSIMGRHEKLELSELEARMGELASLLYEVAEALTYFPGELAITRDATARPSGHLVVNMAEWPSIQEIAQLVDNWRALART
jgi:hypothetical protein